LAPPILGPFISIPLPFLGAFISMSALDNPILGSLNLKRHHS
jgi:hypothetical protein